MNQVLNVEGVLLNEVENTDSIFLYLEGNNWCAYERSAYHLAKALKNITVKKEVVNGYDVVLLSARIGMNDMKYPLSPRVNLKMIADQRLEFHLNNRYATLDSFPEWKERVLQVL